MLFLCQLDRTDDAAVGDEGGQVHAPGPVAPVNGVGDLSACVNDRLLDGLPARLGDAQHGTRRPVGDGHAQGGRPRERVGAVAVDACARAVLRRGVARDERLGLCGLHAHVLLQGRYVGLEFPLLSVQLPACGHQQGDECLGADVFPAVACRVPDAPPCGFGILGRERVRPSLPEQAGGEERQDLLQPLRHGHAAVAMGLVPVVFKIEDVLCLQCVVDTRLPVPENDVDGREQGGIVGALHAVVLSTGGVARPYADPIVPVLRPSQPGIPVDGCIVVVVGDAVAQEYVPVVPYAQLSPRGQCGQQGQQCRYPEQCAVFLHVRVHFFPFLMVITVQDQRGRQLAVHDEGAVGRPPSARQPSFERARARPCHVNDLDFPSCGIADLQPCVPGGLGQGAGQGIGPQRPVPRGRQRRCLAASGGPYGRQGVQPVLLALDTCLKFLQAADQQGNQGRVVDGRPAVGMLPYGIGQYLLQAACVQRIAHGRFSGGRAPGFPDAGPRQGEGAQAVEQRHAAAEGADARLGCRVGMAYDAAAVDHAVQLYLVVGKRDARAGRGQVHLDEVPVVLPVEARYVPEVESHVIGRDGVAEAEAAVVLHPELGVGGDACGQCQAGRYGTE